ncbi:MAG: NUDIX hydrolase N-terminal domain-containing protein [Candidatus Hodarchaeota archaeon]
MSNETEPKEKVDIRTNQIKRWANKLYFLAKEGLDYCHNEYDEKRYEEIKTISESLYKAWKRDQNGKEGFLTLKQLNYFIFRLNDISDSGIKYATSDYDTDRYIECDLIAIDMVQVRDHYKRQEKAELPKETELKKEKEKISTIPLSHFLNDKELADAINNLISGSKDTLWICSPWIDDIFERESELIALKEKKVEITLLTRPAKKDTSHYNALRELRRKRFLIETNANLHSKLIISDESKMYIGSANLLTRSMTVNHEAGIITEDQYLIKPAKEYYNQLYDEAGEQRTTN